MSSKFRNIGKLVTFIFKGANTDLKKIRSKVVNLGSKIPFPKTFVRIRTDHTVLAFSKQICLKRPPNDL